MNVKFLNWVEKDPIRTSFYDAINWLDTSIYPLTVGDIGTIDLSVPDLTYWTSQTSSNLYYAPNYPPCDVYINENTQDMRFLFALSGYEKDPKITFEDDYMIVEMEKESLEKEDKWLSLTKGISTKAFKSKYYLPSKKYNYEEAKATWTKEGLLEIIVPSKEEAKPKSLTVPTRK